MTPPPLNWLSLQSALRALSPLARDVLPGQEFELVDDSIEEGDPDLAVYFVAHSLPDQHTPQSLELAALLLPIAQTIAAAPEDEVSGLDDSEEMLQRYLAAPST